MGSDNLFHKRKSNQRLARNPSNREPYDKVLIVCEGEKTEPNYFTEIKDAHKLNSANIEIIGSGSSPVTIVEYAKEKYGEKKKEGDPYDRVFCVFDKDVHGSYSKALKQIEPLDNFKAITSVPAFEYWLLLHYEYSTRPYTGKPNKSAGAQVVSELQKHLPGYTKDRTDIFSALHDKLETAKTNARKALQAADGTGTDNPSTKVHELVEFLQQIKARYRLGKLCHDQRPFLLTITTLERRIMKDTNNPIVDMPTLRRDLYLVMSLLLADKEVAKVENAVDWTEDFYESEIRRLMLWTTTVVRSLLDLRDKKKDGFGKEACGEYWADFRHVVKEQPLTFRQACNSTIHAKEILPYKVPQQELIESTKNVYVDRITIRGDHRGKITRAQLDIIKFVQTANALINYLEEDIMPTYRDTYKYHFKTGNTIVHTGITNDIDRREAEHQREPGWSKGHITQVGHRTTKEAALEWEREQADKGKPVRRG